MKVLIDKSHIATCGVCQSVLQFDDKDIKAHLCSFDFRKLYSVICPICANEIDITKRMT